MIKNRFPIIFFFILSILLVLSGCIHLDPEKNNRDDITATQLTQNDSLPSFVDSVVSTGSNNTPSRDPGVIANSTALGKKTVSILVVNYSEIRVIEQGETIDRIDENRKNRIVAAALSDERVRALLQDEGMIEGVLYQCHPTPKNFTGPACAPALRVLHDNINWDFLVDEKSQTVVFVQHDLPPGAIF